MNAIELRDVKKAFGRTSVLNGVNLSVPAGSMTAVLGSSGSGKTTLLRLVAGFEPADGGTITIGTDVVDDGRTVVRSQHRGVGFVPQDAALFPHLTALRNVGFGLARADRKRASELLEMVGLAALGDRYPHQLSGGQQQRVALARALAIRPRVVLLDEPFGSLDATLRSDLRRDVARILTEAGTTTILVTHDQDEALALSSRIALLAGGEILASADPKQLYRNPPGLEAAASLGDANIVSAVSENERAVCSLGTIPVCGVRHRVADGPCRLLLRPEQLVLHLHRRDGTVRGIVRELQFHGHDALVQLSVSRPSANGSGDPAAVDQLLARVPGDLPIAPGHHVWIEVAGLARAWPADDSSGTEGGRDDRSASTVGR
jgi:iron(III) transport system ATP-binding protein